jgi:hypothetical protein
MLDWMSANVEITTAFVAMLGVVAGAVFANWDKIFRGNTIVQAEVIDYTPTDDFETEFRCYLERSGMRSTVEATQRHVLDVMTASISASLKRDYPPEEHTDIDDLVREVFAIIQEKMPGYDDYLKIYIPIWKKYYNIKDIQEMNKIQSTPQMRNARAKMPFIMEDLKPKLIELAQRAEQIAQEEVERHMEQLMPPTVEHEA